MLNLNILRVDEIDTQEMGANGVMIIPPTAGTTRYKLPQSNALSMHPGSYVDGIDSGSSQQQSHEGGSNVSFLMKHRIRQAAGDPSAPT
jgi:hypothetical protein